MRMKHLALAAAAIMLAGGLAACGKRGPLEPPPEASAGTKADRAAAEDGKVIEEREQAEADRHKAFILDVLL